MKISLIIGILILLGATMSYGQYFSVKEYRAEDPYDGESVFPELIAPISKNAWPEISAERINYYLKYDVLSKVHGNEGENIFSEVFPPEGEFGGEGEYNYLFYSNNNTFVSLSIDNSFTGAYTEYHDRSYSFNSRNGEHLTLYDFFKGSNYDEVMQKASDACAGIIQNHLETLDEEDEFLEDKRELYKDCLHYFAGEGTSYFNFYLTDSTFVLTHYRCSNHMMAALDDLWDFQVPFTFEELKPYLSDEGLSILFNEARETSPDAHVPEQKVMSGSLDGKYPIHAIFRRLSGDYLNGVYWYDKYMKPISIYGNRMDDGTFEFWEEVKGNKIARIELVYQNGQIMGVWERVDGSNSLPMVLRID